jgi:hypothetical protein
MNFQGCGFSDDLAALAALQRDPQRMVGHTPHHVEHIQPGGKRDVGIQMHPADVVTTKAVSQHGRQRMAAGVEKFQCDAGEIAVKFNRADVLQRIDDCAGAEQIFHGRISIRAGAQQRDVATGIGGGFCNRGGVHQSAGENQRRGPGSHDRDRSIRGGHKDGHARVFLFIKLARTVAQIESRWWQRVAFPAEQPRLTKIIGGGLGGIYRVEDADFLDLGGEGGGDGRGGAKNVKDDDSVADDLLGLELSWKDYRGNSHLVGVIPAIGRTFNARPCN